MSEHEPSHQPAENADPGPDREARVEALAEQYLDQLQASQAPDRQALLAAHPDLADLLPRRLALVEAMHHLAKADQERGSHAEAGSQPSPVELPGSGSTTDQPPAPPVSEDGQGASSRPPPRGERGLRLKCPHCGNRIQVVEPEPREVTCLNCGCSFQVEPRSTTSYHPDALPRTIGKFQVLERLGRGAFGTVYKARDLELDRTVAVKVPRTGYFETEQEEERFLREARSAAQLNHPGIVKVLEIAHEHGVPYIVSEYVEGLTLADLLTGSRPSFRESAELVAQLAEALEYAHRAKIIHRDIKPSNILLDAAGRPHVSDFGLARRDEGEITVTLDGQILGTPAYMAPEQASGDHRQVDGRSDVYSLGVVLYELLTGELPFRGNKRMLLHQVLHDEPRAPRSLIDRIPKDLETICLKAMAKEAGRRFQSAGALAEDLERFLNGEPIRARPVSRVERLVKWVRRRPAVAGLLAAVVLLLILATSGAMVLAIRENAHARWALQLADEKSILAEEKGCLAESNARLAADKGNLAEEEKQTRKEAQQALKREEKARRRAEWLVYSGQIALAQRQWEDGNVAQAWHHLDACRWDLRGWEHRYLYTLFNKNQRTFLGRHTSRVASVAFSPDGKRLASGGEAWDSPGLFTPGELKVLDAATGQQTLTLQAYTHAVTSVAFSPDGKRLVSGSEDGKVQVRDAASGKETLNLKGHSVGVTSVAFSPDGKRLASGSQDHTLKVWDAATGQETFTLEGHTGRVYSVAFSPDGKRLASGSKDRTLKVWDMATGLETLTLKGHMQPITSVAFSPDGKRLASGSQDQTLKVWDTATGLETLTLKGHTQAVSSVSFSPDGKQLASGSEDQTLKVWDAATGQETRSLKGHMDAVLSVVFSSDGKWLASGSYDGTLKVWDAATSPETLILKSPPDDKRPFTALKSGRGHIVISVAFSPDGKRLVTGRGDGMPKVWDAATGQETLTLKGHKGPDNSVAFSPDGKRVASGGDDGVKVWDGATGQETLTLQGLRFGNSPVAFSPDFKSLARGVFSETVVCDAATGQEKLTLKGHTSDVTSVAFSPDGKRLASGADAGDRIKLGKPAELRVWDARTGLATLTLLGHTGGITSVAFSPDGQRLASASFDQTLKVWDAQSGQEIFTLLGHTECVTSVAFSPDGKRLASASWDKTVKVWDAATGQETLTLLGHTREVGCVAFSPDGQQLASVSGHPKLLDKPGELKVWDAQTGQTTFTLLGHTGGVDSVAFSLDSKRLASASGNPFWPSKPGEVKVWDAATGQESLTLKEAYIDQTHGVTSVAFSPDAKRLASVSANGLKVWDAIAGQETLSRKVVQGPVVFSPDGKRLASGYGDMLKVWDAATGQEILTLKGHAGYVSSVAFSPDGKRLASGSWDDAVKVWDAATGLETITLKGHTREVTSVAFSPDGNRLASASRDQTVKVWDAVTGQETLTLKGHTSTVSSVAFSPDGKRLVSGSFDMTLKVWDAATGQETITLRGHTDVVWSVAFSPDGKRLASGSEDKTLKVWDVAAWTAMPNGPLAAAGSKR